VTTRTKARMLAAGGVALGGASTAFSAATGHWWPLVVINVFVFGLTCGIAGVTWWETRH